MSTHIYRSGQGLFGYGYDGLPGEIELALAQEGAVEDLAHEIISKWNTWAEQKQIKTGRRLAEQQLSELGTLASILMRFHVRRKLAPSPLVAEALDHVLGLINPGSGQPMPSDNVLRRFGLPIVDNMDAFLEAARLDGEADANKTPLSQRKLAKDLKLAPSTVRRWREMPEYIRRRRTVSDLRPLRAGGR